jgi:hypothetical protein
MDSKEPWSAEPKLTLDKVERCVLRTAEAIYSHFIAERLDDVFLLKSLDFILIALERPLAIKATSSDRKNSFDTCDTTEMHRSARGIDFPGGVELCVYCKQVDLQQDGSKILDGASNLLEMIAYALKQYAATETPRVGERINSAIHKLNKKRESENSHHTFVKRSPEAMKLLNTFFDRLDPLMLAVGDACFFPSKAVGNARCLRFFFFHRLAPDETICMRLHALASQRRSAAGEYLIKAEKEIWNFNDVISRGQVSWIRWPWEQPEPDAAAGHAFHDYLNNLLQQETPHADPDASRKRNHTGLAVPMHVGRNAWLVVLFVFADNEGHRVELAYHIVRAIVPVLFENIASLARDEYLKLIRDDALTSFRSGKFDIGDLNNRFRNLAQIFPYKEWYLSSNRNQYGIVAFDETNYLHEREKPMADKLFDFEFRPIRRDVVRDRLQHTASEVQYELMLKSQQDARHGADEGIGHALKNIVDLTNWTEALALLRSSIRNHHRLVARNEQHKILERLHVASRSLGLFSLVAGLGHFARLAGAIGRGEYGKFAQWHDAEELRRWNSGDREDLRYICDAFSDTVYRIVASLCSSLSVGKEQPYLFEVECIGASPHKSVLVSNQNEEENRSQFNKFDLHVPPFKKGSDAAYSFVFALTEPLVNALRALESQREVQELSASERALRIHISARLPDEVVFSVINASSVRVQKTLSGFETTRRMLRRVGIAEIENPRTREIRSGVFEVVSDVHFKPRDLANKIADKSGVEACHAT